jgi:hypothetical protein
MGKAEFIWRYREDHQIDVVRDEELRSRHHVEPEKNGFQIG